MLGHFYCQICGKTHADWERMDTLLFCRQCRDWRTVRRFDITEPSKGVFADSDSFFHYTLPDHIKDDVHTIHIENKNMLDWNNIGLKVETMNWINASIINKEQYVRFVIMEFHVGRDRFPEW